MSLSRLSLLDAFKWRHSVRSFAATELSPSVRQVVAEAVARANESQVPFGTKALVAATFDPIGTYGFVSGGKGAIVVGAPPPDDRGTRVDAGVRGQLALMHLARHQIGTVWLAGSYRKSQCDKFVPGADAIAAIPFGVGEVKPGLTQRLIKWGAKSSQRKPLNELFFDVERGKPVTPETAGELLSMFEALRSGPSARNLQPWRFLVDGRDIHVFCAKENKYAMIDIGIAVANTMLLAREMNHEPRLTIKSGITPALGGSYVCSCSFRD